MKLLLSSQTSIDASTLVYIQTETLALTLTNDDL